MHLGHPKTIPAPVPLPRFMEKLSSMKLVLGAKQVGDFFWIGMREEVFDSNFLYFIIRKL